MRNAPPPRLRWRIVAGRGVNRCGNLRSWFNWSWFEELVQLLDWNSYNGPIFD